MTILIIADDEGVLDTVPEKKCDVLVSCGDLPDEVILKVAQRVRCSRILAVKGNHDSSGAFDERITDLHLQLFLHGHQHKNQRTFYAGTKVLGCRSDGMTGPI